MTSQITDQCVYVCVCACVYVCACTPFCIYLHSTMSIEVCGMKRRERRVALCGRLKSDIVWKIEEWHCVED